MRSWDEAKLVVQGGLDYNFPSMYKIRQRSRFPHLADAPKELQIQFTHSASLAKVKPGMRIAIAVGSRGIEQLPAIVKTIVEQLRIKGAEPFIVPAMGSHGGGEAESQRHILESYGITGKAVGTCIESSMDVVPIGQLANGVPLYCDKLAFHSDGIIIVNRIKPHTSFRGEVESGLTKMMVIGLGKHKGADAFHQKGFASLAQMLPQAAPIFLAKAPILCGVGLLENALDRLSEIHIVEVHDWLEREKELLGRAREMLPKLPIDGIDVLIVKEMGKNISGAGMDPNIINRAGSPAFLPAPTPRINKIAVLDLTEESAGNAIGVGVADTTVRRLVDKINLSDMYANAITATVLAGSRIPVTLQNDRDAIAVAVKTSNAVGELKMVMIKNTLEIHDLWVSEGCLSVVKDQAEIEVISKEKMKFDKSGNLLPL